MFFSFSFSFLAHSDVCACGWVCFEATSIHLLYMFKRTHTYSLHFLANKFWQNITYSAWSGKTATSVGFVVVLTQFRQFIENTYSWVFVLHHSSIPLSFFQHIFRYLIPIVMHSNNLFQRLNMFGIFQFTISTTHKKAI